MGFIIEEKPVVIPEPFDHQRITTDFVLERSGSMVFNDPGTGKTRSILDAIVAHRAKGGKKAIVMAPKSILVPSWYRDASKFTPGLKVSIAYAHNRKAAFAADCDVVVTNHDAAKWMLENKKLLDGFDFLCIDESTAFKNASAQRSKSIRKLSEQFDVRVLMTGTPTPRSVLDIWHQALIADGGERLGKSFFHFRNTVCSPQQTGPSAQMVQWMDKEGAAEAVADLLSDIVIRYKFEECISIPANHTYYVDFDMNKEHRAAYDDMVDRAIIELETGMVTAINAASLRVKLLQIGSGAVYDSFGEYHMAGTERYELVADLVEQRSQCVVAFIWKHQRNQLAAEFEKRGIRYAIIDGDANSKKGEVDRIVELFQAGELDAVLAHPQSAGHGLTLTKGVATIWPSPTDNAEHFIQFNRRIYRAGQTQPTETILVRATDTVEERAYLNNEGKIERQNSLLGLAELLNVHLKEQAA